MPSAAARSASSSSTPVASTLLKPISDSRRKGVAAASSVGFVRFGYGVFYL